jgi:hypothetical protein
MLHIDVKNVISYKKYNVRNNNLTIIMKYSKYTYVYNIYGEKEKKIKRIPEIIKSKSIH